MKKISFIKYCFIALLLTCFFQVNSVLAYSLANDGGAITIAKQAGYENTDSANTGAASLIFTTKISQIIAIVLSLVGVLFLVLMIYGGYTWMTAHGNEAQVKKAQTIIYQAVIGLVIVVSAYAITIFVGSTFKF